MRPHSLYTSILNVAILASVALACGPHPDHAASLDIPTLIATNNLARPNRTAPPTKIALSNVRVFDGTRILPPSTVIIDGPLIGADPTGATPVDANGGILLPGLIDAHCHPSNTTHMQDLARWGVTTCFVMACFAKELCTSLSNHVGLPSVLRASVPASAPGSAHGTIALAVTRDLSLLVDNADAVPAWIQRQLDQDPDVLKFVAEAPGLDQETLNLLVAEARRNGKQSVMHASARDAYVQAVRSTTDHIHHAPLDAEISFALVDTMLQQGQISTPTLTMMRAVALTGKGTAGANFSAALSTTAMLLKAGVPVLAGTDANMQPGVPATVPFGTSLHDELANLVEAGMSNVEALRAATVNAARAFGLRDRGVVDVGMRADLVLLDSDPVQDIANTRDIKRVWIGGVEVVPQL